MAKLNAARRQALPRSDFAVPSKAPGSGSYPIPDAPHARNALARSSGKPVAAQVRAAVDRRFPGIAQRSASSTKGSPSYSAAELAQGHRKLGTYRPGQR